MDININVTGLDSIAASLNNLANAIGAQNLATGIEAAAAVAKVQSESKKSSKKGVQSADGATSTSTRSTEQEGAHSSAQSETASSSETSSEATPDLKTNGLEESAASAGSASSESSKTETAAQSTGSSDAPAPMSLEDLRSVVAEAAKKDTAKTQEMVKKYAEKVSLVPEDKRSELAALLAGV